MILNSWCSYVHLSVLEFQVYVLSITGLQEERIVKGRHKWRRSAGVFEAACHSLSNRLLKCLKPVLFTPSWWHPMCNRLSTHMANNWRTIPMQSYQWQGREWYHKPSPDFRITVFRSVQPFDTGWLHCPAQMCWARITALLRRMQPTGYSWIHPLASACAYTVPRLLKQWSLAVTLRSFLPSVLWVPREDDFFTCSRGFQTRKNTLKDCAQGPHPHLSRISVTTS